MQQIQLVNSAEEEINLPQLIQLCQDAAEAAGGIVQTSLDLTAQQITDLNTLLGTTIPAPSGATRTVYVSYKT